MLALPEKLPETTMPRLESDVPGKNIFCEKKMSVTCQAGPKAAAVTNIVSEVCRSLVDFLRVDLLLVVRYF